MTLDTFQMSYLSWYMLGCPIHKPSSVFAFLCSAPTVPPEEEPLDPLDSLALGGTTSSCGGDLSSLTGTGGALGGMPMQMQGAQILGTSPQGLVIIVVRCTTVCRCRYLTCTSSQHSFCETAVNPNLYHENDLYSRQFELIFVNYFKCTFELKQYNLI